jgi:serine/threonine protein kinase
MSISRNMHSFEFENRLTYKELVHSNHSIEVFSIFRNNTRRITKRTKIFDNGFVSPQFLRELSFLKRIQNPPERLKHHPGRNNIIKMLDVYIKDDYLNIDIEQADGTLCALKNTHNIYAMKEKILSDISNGLQYLHELGINHGDLSLKNIMYFDDNYHNDNDDNTDTVTVTPRFVIIDFGNA